jgi:hypothetical protein
VGGLWSAHQVTDELSGHRIGLPFGPQPENGEGRDGIPLYTLSTTDGKLFDQAEYAYQPQAGDVIFVGGNRLVRVVSVVPVEKMGEFVDGGVYGLLEVEPVS